MFEVTNNNNWSKMSSGFTGDSALELSSSKRPAAYIEIKIIIVVMITAATIAMIKFRVTVVIFFIIFICI